MLDLETLSWDASELTITCNVYYCGISLKMYI